MLGNCLCATIFLALLLAYVFNLLAIHPISAGSCPLLELGLSDGFSLLQMPDLAGKVAVVTGANTGLGLASARALARAGATVLMTCRSQGKCDAAVADVRRSASSNAERVKGYILDTADLRSVRDCAVAIREQYARLDIVMLNAGVNRQGLPFAVAEGPGVELTLVTNHLGHFLLVDLLTSTLGAGSRVVVVSSAAHYTAPGYGVPLTIAEAANSSFYAVAPTHPSLEQVLPSSLKESNGIASFFIISASKIFYSIFRWYSVGDTDGSPAYSGFQAYATSKFANILYAQELARRLEARGTIVFSTHPGFVKTNMADSTISSVTPQLMPIIETFCLHPVLGLFWLPEAGAVSQLFAAAGPSAARLPSGEYLINTGRVGTKDPRLENRTTQERFWSLSEELVSLYREK